MSQPNNTQGLNSVPNIGCGAFCNPHYTVQLLSDTLKLSIQKKIEIVPNIIGVPLLFDHSKRQKFDFKSSIPLRITFFCSLKFHNMRAIKLFSHC